MIKEVNIFQAGLQTAESGLSREFTINELDEIVNSYNPEIHEAPIRIGHEDNDKVPAWGWVKGLIRKGVDLYAVVDFSPLTEKLIENKLYKKVSASFYSPQSKINPHPGNWSLRHVALLGAQPPAVKGLKGFAYREQDEELWSFSSSLDKDIDVEELYKSKFGPTLKKDLNPLVMLKEKIDLAVAEKEKEKMTLEEEKDILAVDDMETEEPLVEDMSEETVPPEEEETEPSEDMKEQETEMKEEKEEPEPTDEELEKEIEDIMSALDLDNQGKEEEEEEKETKKKSKPRKSKTSFSEPEIDKDLLLSRIKELEEINNRLRANAEFAEKKAFRTSLERFTSTLYDSGKLTDSVIPQGELVDYMEGLEYGTLEFSEGESVLTPLVNLLNRLPQMVSYEEIAKPEENNLFSESSDPHEKALALVRSEGLSYSEALKKALFG
jgi:hypothetical protein